MGAKKITAAERFAALLEQTNGDAAIAIMRLIEGGPAKSRRIGQSGSTGTTRRYCCNGCGEKLGTESAKYRPTVRETERNAAHLETCSTWDRWDSIASRLAGAEGDGLAVALDAALLAAGAP